MTAELPRPALRQRTERCVASLLPTFVIKKQIIHYQRQPSNIHYITESPTAFQNSRHYTSLLLLLLLIPPLAFWVLQKQTFGIHTAFLQDDCLLNQHGEAIKAKSMSTTQNTFVHICVGDG